MLRARVHVVGHCAVSRGIRALVHPERRLRAADVAYQYVHIVPNLLRLNLNPAKATCGFAKAQASLYTVPMRRLGIDLGTVRTGLAIAESEVPVATPLCTLQ